MLPVAFYNGDPTEAAERKPNTDSQDRQIAVQRRKAPMSLRLGRANVQSPQTLFVVIDPNHVPNSSTWVNNTASLTVLEPDLAVTSVGSEIWGNNTAVITASVPNLGALPAQPLRSPFARDSLTGNGIGTAPGVALAPGTAANAAIIWNYGPQRDPADGVLVYAVVDAANRSRTSIAKQIIQGRH